MQHTAKGGEGHYWLLEWKTLNHENGARWTPSARLHCLIQNTLKHHTGPVWPNYKGYLDWEQRWVTTTLRHCLLHHINQIVGKNTVNGIQKSTYEVQSINFQTGTIKKRRLTLALKCLHHFQSSLLGGQSAIPAAVPRQAASLESSLDNSLTTAWEIAWMTNKETINYV